MKALILRTHYLVDMKELICVVFAAVYNVFHNVAEKYDIMNDVMSGGIHRLWKDYFVRRMSPTPGTRLLDVAGGTGMISVWLLVTVLSGA